MITRPSEWSGRIYVRPLERGIDLVEPDGALSDRSLDDLLGGEGCYRITITWVRVSNDA